MSEATQTATETETAIIPTEPSVQNALNRVEVDTKLFELAQRKAQIYAQSTLVPERYRNNVGNVLIAENMAHRMGADTLMVMQNLYVVHGTPGWSAQFLIGTFNSNGRFSAIKYQFEGEPHTPEWGCFAFCTELSTGEKITGTTITWQMATAEGWVNKNGSKWKTMPEQMFRYRAATFLIRSTAPEIGLGLLTKEELEDMPAANGSVKPQLPAAGVAGVLEQLGASGQTPADESVIDAEIVDDIEPKTEAPAEEKTETSESEPTASTSELTYDEALNLVEEAIKDAGKEKAKKIMAGRKHDQMDAKALVALLEEFENAD